MIGGAVMVKFPYPAASRMKGPIHITEQDCRRASESVEPATPLAIETGLADDLLSGRVLKQFARQKASTWFPLP